MSIDSVDVRTFATALPKRTRIHARLPKSGLFLCSWCCSRATCSQSGNPELANVTNTAQTVTHPLV